MTLEQKIREALSKEYTDEEIRDHWIWGMTGGDEDRFPDFKEELAFEIAQLILTEKVAHE